MIQVYIHHMHAQRSMHIKAHSTQQKYRHSCVNMPTVQHMYMAHGVCSVEIALVLALIDIFEVTDKDSKGDTFISSFLSDHLKVVQNNNMLTHQEVKPSLQQQQ